MMNTRSLKFVALVSGATLLLGACSASSHNTSRYGGDAGYAAHNTQGYYQGSAYQETSTKRSRYGDYYGGQEDCTISMEGCGYMTYYAPPVMAPPPQVPTYTPPAVTECPSGSYLNSTSTGCIQSEVSIETTTTVSTDCPVGSNWSHEFSMCVQPETPTYTPPTYTPPPVVECPSGSYRSMDGSSCIESTPSYPPTTLPPVDWTPIRK